MSFASPSYYNVTVNQGESTGTFVFNRAGWVRSCFQSRPLPKDAHDSAKTAQPPMAEHRPYIHRNEPARVAGSRASQPSSGGQLDRDHAGNNRKVNYENA